MHTCICAHICTHAMCMHVHTKSTHTCTGVQMHTQPPMDTCTNTHTYNVHMHRHTHIYTRFAPASPPPLCFPSIIFCPDTGAQLLSLTFGVMMAEAAKDDSLHWRISSPWMPCAKLLQYSWKYLTLTNCFL